MKTGGDALQKLLGRTKNQLMKIRKFSDGKLISKLSEILPLPAVPLQVVLEKFVEVVDKNPNVSYLWRVEEGSQAKYSELEQQFIEKNYVALAEIFKAAKCSRESLLMCLQREGQLLHFKIVNILTSCPSEEQKRMKREIKNMFDAEGVEFDWLYYHARDERDAII